MTLVHLPTELLAQITLHTIPEGFENLALTCHRFHTICTPFIQDYTTLRTRFRNFDYYENTSDPINTIRTAFDVITRIAIEPVVARYIRHADFTKDSYFTRGRPRYLLADVHCGGAVLSLLARSPYLKEAGLNWQGFYNKIDGDLEAIRYSQSAFAFLMTLLPNLETLKLPKRWKPDGNSDRLIEAIVLKVKQLNFLSDRPSLAQVTQFKSSTALVPQDRFDLYWVKPFLALPLVRFFRGPSCVAMGDDGDNSITTSMLDGGFGNSLVVVELLACCIDDVSIARFLQNTPRLRMLRYSHMAKRHSSPHDWDICRFLKAIEREVGNILEELSISIDYEVDGPIASSKASTSGFQRLRKLELPIEVAQCHIAATTAPPTVPTADCNPLVVDSSLNKEPSISDLVPDSVSELSLISAGTAGNAKILDTIFRRFPLDSTMLSLKEIHLSCPGRADNAYKEQCSKLLETIQRTDVALHLLLFPSSSTMVWNGW